MMANEQKWDFKAYQSHIWTKAKKKMAELLNSILWSVQTSLSYNYFQRLKIYEEQGKENHTWLNHHDSRELFIGG